MDLEWSLAAGQLVGQHWNAVITQNGDQVAARNVSWNAALGTDGRAEFGFNASSTTSNPAPSGFRLNGTTCTGGVDPGPDPNPTPGLPSSFRWSSSGILISPKPDSSHPIVSVKDPTVVRWNNRWIVYATTANTSQAWSLMYTSFADWSQAASAPVYFLDRNPNIGTGYRAAPQLFFFAPQNKWYLVYQTGSPSFSTADDPTRPETWTAPPTFIATEPDIVRQNKGPGQWIDFWVICDTVNCYLFFSDDNGHLYRAQTTLANFPNGFGNTQILLSDSRFALFEAANVYKLRGQNTYLLLHEGIGSDGRRWFRSWTTTNLASTAWTPLPAPRPTRSPGPPASPSQMDSGPGHQSWRADPRRRRPDADHQPVPAAIPVPGHGPQRERTVCAAALAVGAADSNQLHLLSHNSDFATRVKGANL